MNTYAPDPGNYQVTRNRKRINKNLYLLKIITLHTIIQQINEAIIGIIMQLMYIITKVANSIYLGSYYSLF